MSLDAGSESQDIRKFLARSHALSNSTADFFEAIDDAADGFDGNGDAGRDLRRRFVRARRTPLEGQGENTLSY
jgi:hypothetical protein